MLTVEQVRNMISNFHTEHLEGDFQRINKECTLIL